MLVCSSLTRQAACRAPAARRRSVVVQNVAAPIPRASGTTNTAIKRQPVKDDPFHRVPDEVEEVLFTQAEVEQRVQQLAR